MEFNVWSGFLLSCLVLAIAPGAGAVNMMSITMNNSMNNGLKNILIANVGLQIGNIFNLLAVGVGLGSILTQTDDAFYCIQWAGILYLIYLGGKKIIEQPIALEQSEKLEQSSKWSVLAQSALINITNPKSIVFLVALLPQFIIPEYSYSIQMLIMGVTLVSVDSLIMLLYALLARKLSIFIKDPKHIVRMNRVFGAMFICASVVLASDSIPK